MKNIFRKLLLIAGAMNFCTLGFAGNRGNYNYPARDVDSKNTEKSISSRERREMMQQKETAADLPITPDAGPRVANGVDLFLTADFIYWRMREDGLGVGETGLSTSSIVAEKGSIIRPNFKWDPGFKVGLGLNLNHDGWDIYAEYTWLRSNPKANRTSEGGFIINGETAMNSSGFFSSLSTKWGSSFNVVDLELGRNFYVSKYLTTRPHFGFKGAWRHDNLSGNYLGFDSITSENFSYRLKNNFFHWGLGIRTGLDTGWYFFRNFCIFGDFALTALWSKYDVKRKDFQTSVSDPSDVQITRNLSYNFHTIKAVLELALGLRYDVWWSDDNYHFGIQAGWEEQIWFNENQHYNPNAGGSQGDLNLQGLTLKVRFDF